MVRSLKSDGGAASFGGNVGSGNLSLSHVSSNSLDFLRSRSDIDTSMYVGRPECMLEDDRKRTSRKSSHPHVGGNGSRSVASLSRAVGPKDLIQTPGQWARCQSLPSTLCGVEFSIST